MTSREKTEKVKGFLKSTYKEIYFNKVLSLHLPSTSKLIYFIINNYNIFQQ